MKVLLAVVMASVAVRGCAAEPADEDVAPAPKVLADPPGEVPAEAERTMVIPVPIPMEVDPDAVRIDANLVKKVVTRRAGQIRYCYERHLKRMPALEGRVELAWTIDHGRVTSVRTVSDDTNYPELSLCMERKVQRWTFPEDVSGDVTWPFIFRTAD